MDLWTFYEEFSQQLSDPLNVQAYAEYARLRGKGMECTSFSFQSSEYDDMVDPTDTPLQLSMQKPLLPLK